MRPVAPKRQRGAVTLMGAMFLIFAIIVLLSSVQRMAASDIIDTALQNDGIEALFLAETGLERAAWRLSTGSSCAALTGETDTAGRGSFQILSSTLVGTLCRVRTVGSIVTTTAANTVIRTVEADLTQGSSTAVGWAMGKKSGGSENINYWDGVNWSAVSAPSAPNEDLESIYCVTSNDCWAVGKDQNGENIIHWNGSTWSRFGPYGSIPNKELKSVHCVTSNDCWAVGKDQNGENIIHWNGSTWSRSGPYGGIPNEDLDSVYCVASNDCWAVGKRSGGSANIIRWDGSNWSAVSAPSVPNEDLKAVFLIAGTGGSVSLAQWTEVIQ